MVAVLSWRFHLLSLEILPTPRRPTAETEVGMGPRAEIPSGPSLTMRIGARTMVHRGRRNLEQFRADGRGESSGWTLRGRDTRDRGRARRGGSGPGCGAGESGSR